MRETLSSDTETKAETKDCGPWPKAVGCPSPCSASRLSAAATGELTKEGPRLPVLGGELVGEVALLEAHLAVPEDLRRRREFCQFADTPSPSLLKHLLLKGEGGAVKCQSRRRLKGPSQ